MYTWEKRRDCAPIWPPDSLPRRDLICWVKLIQALGEGIMLKGDSRT
jgi:hypothetical protein